MTYAETFFYSERYKTFTSGGTIGEEQQAHLAAHKKLSLSNHVVKAKNLLIIPYDYKHDYTALWHFRRNVIAALTTYARPFKPINNFNIADYPECFL